MAEEEDYFNRFLQLRGNRVMLRTLLSDTEFTFL